MSRVRELYVYYPVAAASAAQARIQVAALHAELRAYAPQVRARLLMRPVKDEEDQTWMEIYTSTATPGEGIDAALQAGIEARASRTLTAISGPRHVEVFEVADVC